jgi:hypothetical protein
MELKTVWNSATFSSMPNLCRALFHITSPATNLVLIISGSTITTFIPNGSSSYVIDSLKTSRANLVLINAGCSEIPIQPQIRTWIHNNTALYFFIICRTAWVSRTILRS